MRLDIVDRWPVPGDSLIVHAGFAIHALDAATRPPRLMEVCGTHTVAIFRHGIRALLPDTVRVVPNKIRKGIKERRLHCREKESERNRPPTWC